MEIWISVKSDPGEYASPGEDTYSADFVKDTLNLAYPGCTGVYLTESGHLVAFYGKKNAPRVELSVEQGMEACQIITEISMWMGKLAKFKVWAVSLQEATDIVNGLKRLKVPLAASSAAVMGQPGGVGLPPLGEGLNLTRPLCTTDDEGMTTDSTVSSKASSGKRGGRGKSKKKTQADGVISDTGASSASTSKGGKKQKKAGINAKVTIPEFGGKAAHPDDTVEAFR